MTIRNILITSCVCLSLTAASVHATSTPAPSSGFSTGSDNDERIWIGAALLIVGAVWLITGQVTQTQGVFRNRQYEEPPLSTRGRTTTPDNSRSFRGVNRPKGRILMEF
jgi:hypothetical protein